ncbi:MAG: DegT/DnrJ/EryC1/StrS family aminotransferase [Chloroflexi bacterium]|nr:DegT/DnrJ/EryC1/StrS family aminotransferase [Chloroflexota bacterium]
MTIPLVDLKAQYRTIQPEIDAAMQRVVGNTSFILGKEVAEFEKNFAAFCGASHCVGTDSGTAALHLALLICGIQPGDEVITTTHTFIATAEVISLVGARPVFVDIDPTTYNLDPNLLERAITPRTRAIIPVHLYGQPAEMDPILDIARRHNLRVIEDAAQAHGAEYRGRRTGTMGDVACFSFYPGKNLGAYGDAGALVTNDEKLAEHARMLRDHGRRDKYKHQIVGYGYRLDALQAAILGAKLPHLDAWNARRREIADCYTELLTNTDLVPPYVPPHVRPVFHLYVVRAKNRDGLQAHLKAQGIEAGIHYPIPLHLQPVYESLGYKLGDFPQTEKAANEILSLPMYPELTEPQIYQIVGAIKEFYGKG